jgi:CheY-like chemotaxis protein
MTTPKNAKKILLVEDDEMAKTVHVMYLKELGYTPDIAENGQQALELAQKNQYDLILMDIGLPDMTGIDVVKKIRAGGKNQRTPIVALTGFAPEDVIASCLAAGMEKVFFKPTDATTLQQIIKQFAA